MPTGLLGPYSAIRVSPATIVGSANGRSISALTNRLPGNVSRTSTHATSVPMTAPMPATISDAVIVITSARTASVLLIESQNVPSPEDAALATTAASGTSTNALM